MWVAYSRNAAGARPRYKKKLAVRKPMHAGNICTSGTGCASGTRDLLDFYQIDLDACGRMVIAYTDNSNDRVTLGGERTRDRPELITFVRQNRGLRFYRKPPNRHVC